jgi:hypothetical protein
MAFVVAAGAAGALASPALAADWDHGRDGRAREWRAHEWREHHRVGYGWQPYAYAAPAYGYYGGAYGYAPAPVPYAAPVGSFSLSIPFAVR